MEWLLYAVIIFLYHLIFIPLKQCILTFKFSNFQKSCSKANRIKPECETDPVTIKHLAHGDLLIGHSADDPNQLSEARSLWESTDIINKVSIAPSLQAAR